MNNSSIDYMNPMMVEYKCKQEAAREKELFETARMFLAGVLSNDHEVIVFKSREAMIKKSYSLAEEFIAERDKRSK